MIEIRKLMKDDLQQAVKVYQSAYAAEPWKEEYSQEEVKQYLDDFMRLDSMRSFVLTDNGRIVGLALTILIPGIGAPYLRIEDFCIASEKQGEGYGSRFIELIMQEAKKAGCDSVLLGTQKGFPAHRFYLKNGFEEIESALLYRNV